MLKNTPYKVDQNLIEAANLNMPKIDWYKLSINRPTGHFFYDPWELKDEFKDTPWESLYDSLPISDKGEARIIELGPNESYFGHADIDDRYHLNIIGQYSYLIDLTTNTMYPQQRDGMWYEMDAGRKHTAANFSNVPRRQLVIRKLLKRATYTEDFVDINITTTLTNLESARFLFDNTISQYLNVISKKNLLFNFNYTAAKVELNLHKSCLKELTILCGDSFIVELIS